jgi:hypothetical protein
MSALAWAHHSTATFDYSQSKTLQGVVRSFQWGNPHNYIQLVVPDGKGGQEEWSIEAGAPSGVSRMGWSNNSLKPGDKVTMVIAPMRDGSHSGTVKTVVLPDGKQLIGVAATLESSGPPGANGPAPGFPTLPRATPKQP